MTAALLCPRTIEQLDDLLAGTDVTLSDDVLDQIDAIVPPGTGIGLLKMGYTRRPYPAAPASSANGRLDAHPAQAVRCA